MHDLIGKRFPVLPPGFIELLDFMGSDRDIVKAARTSYKSSGDEERDKRLLFFMMMEGHTSPFEQAELKFFVRAPLVTFWQWARHRTFHVNSSSGRFTEFDDNSFYVPTHWRFQSESNKQASHGTVPIEDAMALTTELKAYIMEGYRLYQRALERGVSREQARFFLPAFTLMYDWVVKVDLHNLLHFLRLRMDKNAQWEIRAYANAIYEEFVKPLFPWTAWAFEALQLNGERAAELTFECRKCNRAWEFTWGNLKMCINDARKLGFRVDTGSLFLEQGGDHLLRYHARGECPKCKKESDL